MVKLLKVISSPKARRTKGYKSRILYKSGHKDCVGQTKKVIQVIKSLKG